MWREGFCDDIRETLAYDRTRKASLYAKAGVAEYWIVDLVHRELEVYRRPLPDATAAFGFSYAHRRVLRPEDTVTPLARPEAQVAVADLLP